MEDTELPHARSWLWRGGALLMLNAVGAVVFVARARVGWAIPQEHCMIPVAGEPLVWAAAIFPVVLVFLVVNAAWLGTILLRRRWREGLFWLGMLPGWAIAVLVDNTHHC